jgi:hypothetical protein
MSLSTIFQLYRGGGNRKTQRKPKSDFRIGQRGEHAVDQPKTENAEAFPVHRIVHSTPDIEHVIVNNSFINSTVDTNNCSVYSDSSNIENSVSSSSTCINILCLNCCGLKKID